MDVDLLLLGLIKLPIAGLMLWLPFRNDEAMRAPRSCPESSDEDGGRRRCPAVRSIPIRAGRAPSAALPRWPAARSARLPSPSVSAARTARALARITACSAS